MKYAISVHLPDLTLEEEAPILEKNGFTAWEISLPVLDLRKKTRSFADLLAEARRVRKLGADHGITTEAVGVSLAPRHIDADIGYVRQVFELVRETGSTGVRMAGIHFNDPPPPAQAIEKMDDVLASYHRGCAPFHPFFAEQRDLLERLADEAGRSGVRLLLEIHPYYIHNSPSAMLRLIERCPPAQVGVLLDPQGLAMQGYEGSRQSVEALQHYTAHIHVKDSLLTRMPSGKLSHQQSALWEGATPWPLFVAALKWTGFDGYWFDEDFRRPSMEDRLKTRSYLERLWDEAPPKAMPEFCLQVFQDHFA